MAIKDEQPTHPNYLTLCMLDKVLKPLNSHLIRHPAVVVDCYSPVAWDIFLVPGRHVILPVKIRNGEISSSTVITLDLMRIDRGDSKLDVCFI